MIDSTPLSLSAAVTARTMRREEDDNWVEEALRRDREMDENPESVMTHEEFFTSLRDHIK